MADSGQVAHRPGPLKQHNKSHKHGRHRSKGSTETLGRVEVKSIPGRKIKQVRKADRKHQLKQLRQKKREKIQALKRSLGTETTPPQLVVVLSMGSSIGCCENVMSLLMLACEREISSFVRCMTSVFPVTKQRFTFHCPPSEDLEAILNISKIADTLLLVYDTNEQISPFAKLILDTCFAQGLPSTFHVVQGLSDVAVKKQGEVKKRLQTVIENRFPKEKLYRLDSTQDAANVLRFLSDHKRRPVFVRDARPHLLAETWDFTAEESEERGVLQVTGYIRGGRSLSVNQLVHITGFGDYQMIKIESPPDPCPLKRRRKVTSSAVDDQMMTDDIEEQVPMEDSDVKLLEVADPTRQESLISEVIPDPMDGEQTWPLEEELAEAAQMTRRKKVKVPKGTSEYQANWIVESDEDMEGDEESEGEESEEEEDELTNAHQSVSDEISDEEDTTGSMVHTDMDTGSVTAPLDPDQYDALINIEDEQRQLEILQAEKDNEMFPDEVDTPRDIPARERFARYRGLKSFRKSPWDPKENLPLDYARIFQFSNFRSTRKKVLSTKNDQGVEVGMYVTLHIAGVDKAVVNYFQLRDTPLVICGLLPHENKISVVNMVLRRTPNYTQPIKSKEELVFHCGVRKFSAGPIFSEHTLADKHKFERFFRKDGVTVASIYAPIAYPPTKVLVFKALEDGSHVLVATGSVFNVDPDRIVCKKIILSGHPLKIFKRSAVIRYMFFNRDDIAWFKPVELKTKLGLRGHIKEPLGTHGHMKCVFEKQLQGQDTVLMCLYKRVYPKWT